MDKSEQDLIQRVLTGDQEACVQLVNDYSRLVGTIIWRVIGDDRAVEDLAQETFMRVFRALGYYDSRGKLSTWIYTIAHRVAIDHLRKEKSGRRRENSLSNDLWEKLADQTPVAQSQDQEEMLVQETIRQVVHRELALLPDAYRLPLVYIAIEGLDYQTVAEMMNTPVGTVKSNVFRGKQILKEKITHAMRGNPAAVWN